MRIRIVNCREEISRLNSKEMVVHVSFPITTSALLELTKVSDLIYRRVMAEKLRPLDRFGAAGPVDSELLLVRSRTGRI